MQWSRRSVLASGLAVPLAAAFPPTADAVFQATARIANRAQFDALRGEAFLMRCDDGVARNDLHATLTRIDPEHGSAAAVDGCFTLHFEVADTGVATQAIYTIRHPALETFAVLGVPSAADGRSLAVVFNSPH